MSHFRVLAAIGLLGLAPTVFRPAPLASSEHFLLANDNEFAIGEDTTGTIFRLHSPHINPNLLLRALNG
jgi:hypothetical protein